MTPDDLTKILDFAANGASAAFKPDHQKPMLLKVLAAYFQIVAEMSELSETWKIKQEQVKRLKILLSKIKTQNNLSPVINLQTDDGIIHLDFTNHDVLVTKESIL
jgi:hypothetical protein